MAPPWVKGISLTRPRSGLFFIASYAHGRCGACTYGRGSRPPSPVLLKTLPATISRTTAPTRLPKKPAPCNAPISPPPRAEATRPPMSEPATPSTVVITRPIRCLPGTTARARRPITKPNTIHARMPTRILLRSTSHTSCLAAGNNEVIGTNEMYSSASAPDNGIESCKSNGPGAPVKDQT